MPFFSVVIPLFNKETYIKDTLASVLEQTFKDFEVIIVDDGSTDRSFEIASSFDDSRIKIFKQKNRGASETRNYGIEMAQGKYIALLDADDIWYPNHLQELKNLIETFPNAGLFCTNYEIKRNQNLVTPAKFNFTFGTKALIIQDFFKASKITFIPTSSSAAFLKKIFYEVGPYNSAIKSGQDIDLWIRMGLKYEVSFSPKITMTYNFFNDLSLSKTKSNRNRYDFINAYSEEETNNKSLKLYLDINRYALAIRCILNNEIELYECLKAEIDYKNLNHLQNLIIRLPKKCVFLLKKLQNILLRKGIYLTAYK